ncbi:ribosome-associated GTPase [gut metagenome]|uniref:Ribosome-associated GTPase n=1 Tax=gut metagenome TaxID=749906 RepID=J9H3E7_9ZZZZ
MGKSRSAKKTSETGRVEEGGVILHGMVVRNTGSWYEVRTDDGQILECKVKGNFRLRGIRSTNPVAVGDGVTLRAMGNDAAFITEIDERRNYIIRKASNLSKQSHILAANIDLAVLVVTIARPETSTTFIDRFLASAEAYRVPVVIAFNKTDDLTSEEKEVMDYLMAVYREVGYACFAISALTGDGVNELSQAMAGKVNLLAGHSGVGKSTLLNLLVPDAHVRTAEISAVHGTGMHTTTFSELYDLPVGGCVIDIPGIKGFGTFDMEPEEVAHYFKDIFKLSADCRFNNCTHTHEPGCAVMEALEQHRLAPSRYASYLSMLEDKEEGKYRSAF